ncbi:MAG: response regulator [Magnetococcales bacterium]|nr:response regulator [Magnetococcales bacterium]
MAIILIIDDHAPTVEHIARLLSEAGHQADYLLESSWVTQKLENDPVDLILLDVYMPDMDGLSVLKSIRDNPESREIPVIMITGEMEDRLVKECFQQGAVDFIAKPVHRLELLSRIENVLLTRDYIHTMEEQKHSLAQAKEFIETVMNSMTDQLCVIDAHSMEILEVNLAFTNVAGVEREKMIGKACFQVRQRYHQPCCDCPVNHQEERESCLFLATFMQGESLARHGAFVDGNGAHHQVYMTANAVIDVRGGIRQVVYQCRDDSEYFQMEERCRQLLNNGETA